MKTDSGFCWFEKDLRVSPVNERTYFSLKPSLSLYLQFSQLAFQSTVEYIHKITERMREILFILHSEKIQIRWRDPFPPSGLFVIKTNNTMQLLLQSMHGNTIHTLPDFYQRCHYCTTPSRSCLQTAEESEHSTFEIYVINGLQDLFCFVSCFYRCHIESDQQHHNIVQQVGLLPESGYQAARLSLASFGKTGTVLGLALTGWEESNQKIFYCLSNAHPN